MQFIVKKVIFLIRHQWVVNRVHLCLLFLLWQMGAAIVFSSMIRLSPTISAVNFYSHLYLPSSGFKTAFNINKAAFVKVFLSKLGKATPQYNCVPPVCDINLPLLSLNVSVVASENLATQIFPLCIVYPGLCPNYLSTSPLFTPLIYFV